MSKTREEFFRHSLVATGTLVELLMYQVYEKHFGRTSNRVSPSWGARMGTLLWEPLNVIAWHLLEHGTPMEEFMPVEQELHIFQTILKDWLATLNARGFSTPKVEFERGSLRVKLLATKLEPVVQRIYALLKYDKKKPVQFATPGFARWRTFARNLHPERTIREFELPDTCIKDARHLASSVGTQKAIHLWFNWFPVNRGPVQEKLLPATVEVSTPSDTPETSVKPTADLSTEVPAPATLDYEVVWKEEALPTFVKVRTTNAGILEVTAEYTPSFSFPLSPEARQELPLDFKKRLARRAYSVECAYRDLDKSVQAVVTWFQNQALLIPELDADYHKYKAATQRKELMDRLKKSFTAEEIALLAETLSAAQNTERKA